MNQPPLDTVRHDDAFAANGVRYHRVRIAPRDESATAARLAVLHGYGDHGGRYVEAMEWLASRGVACHAFDFRGHGRSSGRRAYVRRWDEYLDDLDAFLSQPDLSHGGAAADRPLFVLGHSHGGLVAAMAGVRGLLARHGVAGCVLSAPYLVNALAVPRRKRVAARIANVVCPWLRIRSGITPRMTSSDPEMIEDSRRDPLLLRRATPRWFMGQQLARAEVLRRAGEFTLPMLVVQGDADPIADPRGARQFHDRAGSTDKALIEYPGLLHEPLRERGRERMFADIYEWITQRAPSGQRVAMSQPRRGGRK
jgi:lysophospholipase